MEYEKSIIVKSDGRLLSVCEISHTWHPSFYLDEAFDTCDRVEVAAKNPARAGTGGVSWGLPKPSSEHLSFL
jgi:hypothetical protein